MVSPHFRFDAVALSRNSKALAAPRIDLLLAVMCDDNVPPVAGWPM